MRVVEIGEEFRERYDEYCRSSGAMLYYSWEYKTFLQELLGAQPSYFGVLDATGHFKAIFPLMRTEGAAGTVYNSLPFFGSYGGVQASTPEAERLLWAAYGDMLNSSTLAAATIVLNPMAEQRIPVPWDFQDYRIGQFTRLDFGTDAEAGLLSRIDPSARRNLKAAERAGVIAEVDNSTLQVLRDIHRANILDIGGRPKPDSFFKLLPNHFVPDSDYRVYVARIDGEIVAALLLFYAGDVVEYFTPGTVSSARTHQPSALLIKQAMLDAAAQGYRLWNWGGTWESQEGVLRFKRKWGAVDHVYRYFTRVVNRELLRYTAARLQAEYGFFYTVPFSALEGHGERV